MSEVTIFPYDGSGTSPTNRVTENHTITEVDGFEYIYTKNGPFYGSNTLKIRLEDGTLLDEDKDYTFVRKFVDATLHVKKPIYAAIAFISRRAKGNVSIELQALGDEFSFKEDTAVRGVVSDIQELKRVSFDSLINKPKLFPVIYHDHAAASDLLGAGELTVILREILESVKQDGDPTHRHDVDSIVGLTERLANFISVGNYVSYQKDMVRQFDSPHTGTIKITIPKVVKRCAVVVPIEIIDGDRRILVVASGDVLTPDTVGSKLNVDNACCFISGKHEIDYTATMAYNPDGSMSVHVGDENTEWVKPFVSIRDISTTVPNALNDRVIDIISGSNEPDVETYVIQTASIEDLNDMKQAIVTVIESEVNTLNSRIDTLSDSIGNDLGGELGAIRVALALLTATVANTYVPKTGGTFSRLTITTKIDAAEGVFGKVIGKLLSASVGAPSDYNAVVNAGKLFLGINDTTSLPNNGKNYGYDLTAVGTVNDGIELKLNVKTLGSNDVLELLKVVGPKIVISALVEADTITSNVVNVVDVLSVKNINMIVDEENAVDAVSSVRVIMGADTGAVSSTAANAVYQYILKSSGNKDGYTLTLTGMTNAEEMSFELLHLNGKKLTVGADLAVRDIFNVDSEQGVLVKRPFKLINGSKEWKLEAKSSGDIELSDSGLNNTMSIAAAETVLKAKSLTHKYKLLASNGDVGLVIDINGTNIKFTDSVGNVIMDRDISDNVTSILETLKVVTEHGTVTVKSINDNAHIVETTLPLIQFNQRIAAADGILFDGTNKQTMLQGSKDWIMELGNSNDGVSLRSKDAALNIVQGSGMDISIDKIENGLAGRGLSPEAKREAAEALFYSKTVLRILSSNEIEVAASKLSISIDDTEYAFTKSGLVLGDVVAVRNDVYTEAPKNILLNPGFETYSDMGSENIITLGVDMPWEYARGKKTCGWALVDGDKTNPELPVAGKCIINVYSAYGKGTMAARGVHISTKGNGWGVRRSGKMHSVVDSSAIRGLINTNNAHNTDNFYTLTTVFKRGVSTSYVDTAKHKYSLVASFSPIMENTTVDYTKSVEVTVDSTTAVLNSGLKYVTNEVNLSELIRTTDNDLAGIQVTYMIRVEPIDPANFSLSDANAGFLADKAAVWSVYSPTLVPGKLGLLELSHDYIRERDRLKPYFGTTVTTVLSTPMRTFNNGTYFCTFMLPEVDKACATVKSDGGAYTHGLFKGRKFYLGAPRDDYAADAEDQISILTFKATVTPTTVPYNVVKNHLTVRTNIVNTPTAIQYLSGNGIIGYGAQILMSIGVIWTVPISEGYSNDETVTSKPLTAVAKNVEI